MSEKLAAVLLTIMVEDESGRLVPAIDRDRAKTMTAREIISVFDFDHYPIPKALDGSNHPTNLVARVRAEHRGKTAKIDVPMIAKVKRVSAKHEEFRRRMLAKASSKDADENPAKKRSPKIKSRGFQAQKGLKKSWKTGKAVKRGEKAGRQKQIR